jgi:AcrR family transcriptional regulator
MKDGGMGRPRSFNKDAALARATEVFWLKGYEGTSMADLTAAMGITSPSLYAAFDSKEELFRQALRHYETVEDAHIWGQIALTRTAYAAVETFLLQTARVFTRRTRPPGCLVVLSALHPNKHSDTVRRELIKLRARTMTELRRCLHQGIAGGEISPKADLDMRSRDIMSRFNRACRSRRETAQIVSNWNKLPAPRSPRGGR